MFDSDSLVSSRERAAVLALLARRSLPWNRLAGAIEEKGSALDLLRELDDGLESRLFDIDDHQLSLDRLEDQVHSWAAEEIQLATVLDVAYPANLRTVHDRPPALFVTGALDASRDERSVAVVGTRKASAEGRQIAEAVATTLVKADYVVLSGLAEGIDTAAHTSAMGAGGRTVAVIGTGLRESFPKKNAELQEKIGAKCAVVSQFWPGQGPRKWTFPQRNAVMSGLGRATVVIEASHTSGARMQARLATEHGRPVFLLESLLQHEWAKAAADRSGVYVVSDGAEVVGHLERLYADQLVLA
jgi:DNA processing protein